MRLLGRLAKMNSSLDLIKEMPYNISITDPKLLPQWWGPRYLSTLVDMMDMRPGGQWRLINRDTPGNEYAFHGGSHQKPSHSDVLAIVSVLGITQIMQTSAPD